MKICFVHNRLTEYRKPLFEKLAGIYDIDFFFANTPEVDIPIRAKLLKGYMLPKMSELEIVPGLSGAISGGGYDIYCSGGLSTHYTYATRREALRRGKPFVLWTGGWMEPLHPRRRLCRQYERRVVADAHSIITYSEKGRDFIVRERGGDPSRIFVAYNSVKKLDLPPPSSQQLRALRDRFGIGDKKIILFMGRLIPFKGIPYLLEAFSLIEKQRDDAALLIAGTGPLLDELSSRASALKLANTHFTREYVDPAAKNLLLSSACALALPSITLRNNEPWGLVVNEACHYGLPVVCSDAVGAHGELVIDGETGYVTPEKNPEALAAALHKILDNPDRAAAMGRAAARRVDEICTLDRMTETFRKAFTIS